MKNDPKAEKKNLKDLTFKSSSADPIEAARTVLNMAREDYKRVREINAGEPKVKQDNPARTAAKKELVDLKAKRKSVIAEIKAAKEAINSLRKAVKDIHVRTKELKACFKTLPRSKAENKAVEEAKIALLEAELAFRKACLGG